MTDRRSFQTWTERMSRQAQFVPGHVGGRVASAQPVKRRATIGQTERRPIEVDVWAYFSGGGQLNYGQTNYPMNTIENLGGTDGETYVALLTCVAVPALLPTGWTELLSGSVGDLYYRAGYIQWTGSTPQEQIADIDGATSAPTNQGRMVWNMWGITGHHVPACGVTEQASATSHPFRAPDTSWGSPWNMNAYLAPYPAGTSSTTGTTPELVNYGEGAGYPFLLDDMSAEQYGASGACPAIACTRTTTNAWDSASFAFGWVS